eukprot:Amastigsp_a509385_45.p3 type:complete len:343 gc:universal Amastigsp_a509385_45:1217-189(-)
MARGEQLLLDERQMERERVQIVLRRRGRDPLVHGARGPDAEILPDVLPQIERLDLENGEAEKRLQRHHEFGEPAQIVVEEELEPVRDDEHHAPPDLPQGLNVSAAGEQRFEHGLAKAEPEQSPEVHRRAELAVHPADKLHQRLAFLLREQRRSHQRNKLFEARRVRKLPVDKPHHGHLLALAPENRGPCCGLGLGERAEAREIHVDPWNSVDDDAGALVLATDCGSEPLDDLLCRRLADVVEEMRATDDLVQTELVPELGRWPKQRVPRLADPRPAAQIAARAVLEDRKKELVRELGKRRLLRRISSRLGRSRYGHHGRSDGRRLERPPLTSVAAVGIGRRR